MNRKKDISPEQEKAIEKYKASWTGTPEGLELSLSQIFKNMSEETRTKTRKQGQIQSERLRKEDLIQKGYSEYEAEMIVESERQGKKSQILKRSLCKEVNTEDSTTLFQPDTTPPAKMKVKPHTPPKEVTSIPKEDIEEAYKGKNKKTGIILPKTPSWGVGTSLVTVRSALFGIVAKRGARPFVHDLKVATWGKFEVSFTGELLDQNDLDVLMALLSFRHNFGDNYGGVKFSLYQLHKHLGYKGHNYQALKARLERLYQANFEIRFDNGTWVKMRFINSMAGKEEDNGDGLYWVEFDPRSQRIFEGPQWQIIDRNVRQNLPEKAQLARWLQGFIESQSEEFCAQGFALTSLHSLSRSNLELKYFKRDLKNAMEILTEASQNAKKRTIFEWGFRKTEKVEQLWITFTHIESD